MHRSLTPAVLLLSTLACATHGTRHEAAHVSATQQLTMDDVFELPAKMRLSTTTLGWLPNSASYLATQGDGGARKTFVVDAASGERSALVDAPRLKAALSAAGLDETSAASWSTRTNFTLNAAKDGALFNEKNDLWFAPFGADKAVRLTNDEREEVGETLSPDGAYVGFIANWNLHIAPTDGSAPARALTTAGDENHLYGRLDWVYQEEVYGRGNFGAFWWSPDAKKIAYLVIDETDVPTYTVTDHRQTHPLNENWRYPKAGDPNPIATLHVVDVESGVSTAVDLAPWANDEALIVRVGWTPDSSRVWFQIQNRVQTWLDLVYADPSSGATRKLFRDHTEAWIEPVEGPTWIDDGARFLWLSERDGFAHLYVYDKSGKPLGRATQGAWEVDSFLRYDERASIVYFVGDKADVKGAQLFRCKLDGSALERLTKGEGTHAITMSEDGAYFLDSFSSTRAWPKLSLHRADGTLVRELEHVDATPAVSKGIVAPEFLALKARDGAVLEGMLIRPPHFDPSKRYPVLCAIYGGPHAPKVLDRALGFEAFWHTLLAQSGYLVWVFDNRSCGGRGLASEVGVYKHMGAEELRDIEDGLDFLVARGWADPERIGIWGWSYGGYQTSYCLTHSKRFKCGIAGAPVTDWRLYDSIYTERYMGLPDENKAGYDASSPQLAAKDLSGKLLVIHGVIDENVHLQNSLQFAEKLQEAGRQFELMLYPGNRHPVVNPAQRRHLYEMMTQFLRANL